MYMRVANKEMKNMKKIIALLLALVMCVGLVACGEKTPEKTEPDNTQTETPAPEDTTPSEDVTTPEDGETGDDATEGDDEATTPEEGEGEGEDVLMAETAVLLDTLSTLVPMQFPLGVMTIDHTDLEALEAYTGLKANDGIVEMSVMEPLMGSMAYSVVLVKLDGTADAEAMATNIKDSVNPRKWICVEADDLNAAVVGEYVIFAMLDDEYKEDATAKGITDAFVQMMNDAPAADAPEADAENAG